MPTPPTQETVDKASPCKALDKDRYPASSFVNPPDNWQSLRLRLTGEKRFPKTGEFILYNSMIYLHLGGQGYRPLAVNRYHILVPAAGLDEFPE